LKSSREVEQINSADLAPRICGASQEKNGCSLRVSKVVMERMFRFIPVSQAKNYKGRKGEGRSKVKREASPREMFTLQRGSAVTLFNLN